MALKLTKMILPTFVSVLLISLTTISAVSGEPVIHYSNATPTTATTITAATLAGNPNIDLMQTNTYTRATHELLLDLRQQMLTRAIKFDDHFRSVLSSTKVSLHNLFMDTYGLIYEQNTEIFTEMFENLEQYYASGRVKLTKTMEEFFKRLYQKIFQVLNSSKIFTNDYLDCATDQLAHLKPFKEVPSKLMSEIRHVFVAARTFNQALNHGIDVIKHIISLGQSTQCTNLINEKLLKNALKMDPATGTIRLPCLSFCEQVITKCVGKPSLDQLHESWMAYVMALSDLATKLSTNYDIETIIKSMDVQISEAIMNFQDNGTSISDQVFNNCGRDLKKQTSNRIGKRAANPSQNKAIPVAQPIRRHESLPLVPQHQPRFSLGSHLGATAAGRNKPRLVQEDLLLTDDLKPLGKKPTTLIEEIKSYMSSTKSFWLNLPNAVCTSNNTLGSNATSNKRKQSNSCFQEHLGLSNINSDIRYRKEIQLQSGRLDEMHSKILNALDGIEIDWGTSADQKPGFRLPSPTTTTTTTTTTPEPTDDYPEEDDSVEGSGNAEPPPEDSEDFETDPTPESFEESDPEDDLSTMGGEPTSNPDGPGNEIDQPQPPNPTEEASDNLITPPTQDAQKSGAFSSLKVIDNHTFFFLLCIVLIVIPLNLIFCSLTLERIRAKKSNVGVL